MMLRTFIEDYKEGFSKVVQAIEPADVAVAAELLRAAFERGRQIIIAGNGGSAATASHMACDLAKTTLGKGAELPARRIRVVALTDNVPLLTAWGNDVGYDCVFAEQLRNLAGAGDLLVVISASGNSPNIVAAVRTARELGMQSLALLGFEGGAVKSMADHSIVVRSTHYGFIEDAHSMLSHLLTDYLKQFVQAG